MVTQSLWPANKSYGIRQLESARFNRTVNTEIRYLGLKEEDLFTTPYDPLTYIGATMEATWAAELKTLLELIQKGKDALYIFYPSASDGAGHVVHQFTRNITITALGTMSGDLREYTYNVYAEPTDARPVRCDVSWKYPLFKTMFPTQWAVIKDDLWAANQVKLHSTTEWIKKT